METQVTQNFQISSMRLMSLPEITFFYVVSQPVANLDEVMDPLLEAIYQARQQALVTVAGPDIIRYYPADGGKSELRIMEAGISVRPEIKPAGAARLKILPPYPSAGLLLWGGLSHIVQAYETLMQAMQDAGLQHNGEVREITYSFEAPDSPNNVMGIYMGIG